MMQNAFYFMLKALFVLEIFTFLYGIFGYVEKQLNEKAIVNFKSNHKLINYVTDWIKNLCNTNIGQYLIK